MTATFANLRDVRETLLGFGLDSAARLSGVGASRLAELEAGRSPTVYELELLSELYGVDAELLADEPISLDPCDAVQVLMSQDEFKDVGDLVKARIVAAATAARDARKLEKLNGIDAKPPTITEREVPDRRLPDYRRGASFAAHVRTKLALGTKAIPSMRDLVRDNFPSILVLYADLTGDGPAGVTFADPLRGATIVLNLRGRNMNPAVRRFSLAHELCHVLLDAHHVRQLAVVSGYLPEIALARERCANAFAVRLLCPERELKKIQRASPTEKTLRTLLEDFGLSYGAARLYLRNETNEAPLPPTPPPSLAALGTDLTLEAAERAEGIDNFPLMQVPPERRTVVAMYGARAYAEGRIPRDRLADLLRVTPGADLEAVLDFFGMSQPSAGKLSA